MLQVAAGVNGPIFASLGKRAGHKDLAIVEVFRSGGDLVGVLACTGNGKPIDGVEARGIAKRIASLTGSGGIKTRIKTLKGLRADEHADKLMAIVEANAKLGRMSKPVCITPSVFLQQDNSDRCFSKAFTVEQGVYMFCLVMFVCSPSVLCAGLKDDGDVKLRAVYNFTGSGVNEVTVPTEKLKCDALDALLELISFSCGLMGDELEMLKADIDSAFCRVPVKPEHRDLTWVAWRVNEMIMAIARHYAMPFGAIAAVHYWDRIGQSFAHLHFMC